MQQPSLSSIDMKKWRFCKILQEWRERERERERKKKILKEGGGGGGE
jgi:hypothetical protein